MNSLDLPLGPKTNQIPMRENIGDQLQTTATYPIYYQSLTKCGCTYIKNLMYALDHDEQHAATDNIHGHKDELQFASGSSVEQIVNSPYAFIVMRDPVDRFLSLYYDKIFNVASAGTNFIAKSMADRKTIATNEDLDLAGHQQNCLNSLDWIERNIKGKTDMPVNWHWKPQKVRLKQVAPYNFNVLTLDGLSWQLPHILSPIVPDIKQKMQSVTARNSSAKIFPKKALLTDEIVSKIKHIYRQDCKIYATVSEFWAQKRNELVNGTQSKQAQGGRVAYC